MAKKAKSPTGNPSKKKPGAVQFDKGKKAAGKRTGAYSSKKKAPVKKKPPPGGAAERAAAAIRKGRRRVKDQT